MSESKSLEELVELANEFSRMWGFKELIIEDVLKEVLDE